MSLIRTVNKPLNEPTIAKFNYLDGFNWHTGGDCYSLVLIDFADTLQDYITMNHPEEYEQQLTSRHIIHNKTKIRHIERTYADFVKYIYHYQIEALSRHMT